MRRLQQLLGAQDLVVDAAVGQRDLIGAALVAGGRLVADPQQAPADDVDEQERHVPRPETLAQVARHDVQRTHRRGLLRRRQYIRQTDPVPHSEPPKL